MNPYTVGAVTAERRWAAEKADLNTAVDVLNRKRIELDGRVDALIAECDRRAAQIASQQEYIDLLENQVIAMMTEDEPHEPAPDVDCYTLPDGSCIAPVCPLHGPLGNLDNPVPFLPVDPEEQRRRDTTAADGSRAMIYRGRS